MPRATTRMCLLLCFLIQRLELSEWLKQKPSLNTAKRTLRSFFLFFFSFFVHLHPIFILFFSFKSMYIYNLYLILFFSSLIFFLKNNSFVFFFFLLFFFNSIDRSTLQGLRICTTGRGIWRPRTSRRRPWRWSFFPLRRRRWSGFTSSEWAPTKWCR